MSSSDEGSNLSGASDAENSVEDTPTRNRKAPSLFKDDIPSVKYGDLIEKLRREKKRGREEADGGDQPAPKKARRRAPPKEPEPTIDDVAESENEELDDYLQHKEEVDHSMRSMLWTGYVRLCEAADFSIGQPSGFGEIVRDSKDIKDCFDLCVEKGSFAEITRSVDPVYMLLGVTAMVMFSCKQAVNYSGPAVQQAPVRQPVEAPQQPQQENNNNNVQQPQAGAKPAFLF